MKGRATTIASRTEPSAGIWSFVPVAKCGRLMKPRQIAALLRIGEIVLLVIPPIGLPASSTILVPAEGRASEDMRIPTICRATC